MVVNGTSGQGDAYELAFGFRSVVVTPDGIFVNGAKFYCTGFGMHEDADVKQFPTPLQCSSHFSNYVSWNWIYISLPPGFLPF